ncbi:SRPBCC family protein [Cryptosporangium phraense]|uniref:SRPBCC domain-containing protein n=1 Tax=Cryptosporangium phraense TaxID=2593070 RepID=A0A545AVK6_9ACTN|nr:SRPBCC domain-containing protein [Cryptosporangium phraense]TQS45353.1 SRPBCC domain-containing protein [Cryptosporangium phraense]
MTVISATPDPEARTLTLVAEFSAPPKAVWQLWADPRLLERWWGPPTYPATFREHDFTVGGEAKYHMTGPEGDTSNGWWRFTALDEPNTLEFRDGFADENGNPSTEMPETTIRVDIAEIPSGTRMTMTSSFASAEQLEQLVNMGMLEGMKQAAGQIDALLAA